MFFISLLRWLRGTVTFLTHSRSGRAEQFFNLCMQQRIPFWGCRPRGLELEGRTTPSGYRRMHPVARRTGVRPRIQKKQGAPFLLHRYRRRVGLLAGLLLAAALLAASQQFIWVIQVEGCSTQEQVQELTAAAFLLPVPLKTACSVKCAIPLWNPSVSLFPPEYPASLLVPHLMLKAQYPTALPPLLTAYCTPQSHLPVIIPKTISLLPLQALQKEILDLPFW